MRRGKLVFSGCIFQVLTFALYVILKETLDLEYRNILLVNILAGFMLTVQNLHSLHYFFYKLFKYHFYYQDDSSEKH